MKTKQSFAEQNLLIVLILFLTIAINTNCYSSNKANAVQTFRTQISLNNDWKFKKENTQDNLIVNLPHTWNKVDATKEGSEYHRGIANYQKTIELKKEEGLKYFLYFECVNQEATIRINNDSVGKHGCGYTSFSLDISKFVKGGSNDINVKVSNLSNDDIAPLSMDFTFYGGIYRDVYLISTNSVHFDVVNYGANGVAITTPRVSAQSAEVGITTRLMNESKTDRKLELTHRIINAKGEPIQTFAKNMTLKSNSSVNEINLNGEVKTPELWSPDSPALYTVVSEIKDVKTGEVLDRVVNTIGFRWFSMDAQKGFFLNGEHLKLAGVSKHQDLSGYGSAVSNELLIKDMEQIKALGANCFRTSHYPPDPEVLAACDRLGILVLEEIPLVNSINETRAFFDNCQLMLKEMITRDLNHPCIFSWGLSNEICIMGKGKIGSERGNEYDKCLHNLISGLDSMAKHIDPYRLTTQSIHYKTERYEKSGVIKMGDYIGTNLYMGWYLDVPDSLVSNAKKIQLLTGNKPIVISEYGAGADPRLRSDNPRRFDFSLDYQTLAHKIWYKYIKENDFVSGSFVWNFADFSSPHRGDTNPLINNKGLVSYDRIPKDAFYFYQAALGKKPVISIGMKNWNLHTGVENKPGTCSKKIEVFTNMPEAEMFINGISLGRKKVIDYSATWEAPLIDGKNQIEVAGFAPTGEVVKDFHTLNFQLIPADLKQIKAGDAIRINAGCSAYFLDEEENGVWLPDREYAVGGFGFVGGKALVTSNNRVEYREGIDANIKETTKEPLFQTQRIGVEEFKADVPAGQYEVTIYVADLSVNAESSVYELRAKDDTNKTNRTGEIEFDILINGQKMADCINPKKLKGELTAYEFSTIVYTNSGLNINFVPNNGVVGINGLKIKKLK